MSIGSSAEDILCYYINRKIHYETLNDCQHHMKSEKNK